MSVMSDEVVDLTLTNPPYADIEERENFDFDKIAAGLQRVTKLGGILVWIVADALRNGTTESGGSFRQVNALMEAGFSLRDTMIMQCSAFAPFIQRNRKSHEQHFQYAFVMSKGDPKTFNALNMDRERGNVWTYDAHESVDETKTEITHALMPMRMALEHIQLWSCGGDTVFDPFLGTGTVAVAAGKTARNFIGCEIKQYLVENAKGRVMKMLPQGEVA